VREPSYQHGRCRSYLTATKQRGKQGGQDESEEGEDSQHISHGMIIVNKPCLFILTQTGLC
jgi:hypothetical protein